MRVPRGIFVKANKEDRDNSFNPPGAELISVILASFSCRECQFLTSEFCIFGGRVVFRSGTTKLPSFKIKLEAFQNLTRISRK